MLVKPDMVSPFLHVVTIGVAFVLHRIISTLRILRPVESESASQASSRILKIIIVATFKVTERWLAFQVSSIFFFPISLG